MVSQAVNTQGTATVKLGVYLGDRYYFNGLIDDARIYTRQLSLKEVWILASREAAVQYCADLNSDESVDLNDLAKLSKKLA